MVIPAKSLEGLHVASPCPARWDDMQGDERVRFCRQCNLNVYNISGMNRDEATQLIGESEGRLCIRMLKRADGTVITRDCPVGLRAVRLRVAKMASATVALLTALVWANVALSATSPPRRQHSRLVSIIREFLGFEEPVPCLGVMVCPQTAAPVPPPTVQGTQPGSEMPESEPAPVFPEVEPSQPESPQAMVPIPYEIMGRVAHPGLPRG